jgi:serine/threonine-protein kinase HipA
MIRLAVELYGELVGFLNGHDRRTFDFEATTEAVERLGLGSTDLSVSVPLLTRQVSAKAGRRRNFFAELLPEGNALENLANSARVDTTDVPALLESFGRDVAGALQIYNPANQGEPRTPSKEQVSNLEIADLLKNTQNQPLGNRPRLGRTSLAGVQEKIVLAKASSDWHQVFDGYPSTHILKPVSTVYPSMIFDEEYGFRICKALGLTNYDAWLESFGDSTAFVVQRFDRTNEEFPGRIHQEDMNQALGASGNQKYQEYGGKITLLRIAKLLSEYAEPGSRSRLLVQVTAAQAMGNLDMHGKNISVFHSIKHGISLTPAYDMVPQRHLDSGGAMALAINGKYLHSQITKADLISEGMSWGVADAAKTVNQTLEKVLAYVKNNEPAKGSAEGLNDDIECFTSNLLADEPTG